MQSRHIEMIAVGCSIGTGLLLKSGGAIFTAGPIGALIPFMIVGIQVFGVMTSLGEMATYLPVEGVFSQLPTRFLNPAYGFASGWNYWLNWALTIPTELAAIGGFMSLWVSVNSFPAWAWSGIYLLPLAILNTTGVENFAETEFSLSILKVLAVIIFIAIGIFVWFGVGQGTGPLWFKNWAPAIAGDSPIHQFKNISGAFVTAFYSYGGTEMIGIAASEASNPRKSVPKAVNGTFWRINFFYIGAIFMLGVLLPPGSEILNPNNPSGVSGSPFVYIYNMAGISAAGDIMNAVIIVACLSATNTSIYVCSRTLMRLADEGNAPKILGHVTKTGVPIYALLFSVVFGIMSVVGGYLAGTNNVFNFLSSLVSLGILGAWMTTSYAHLRFRHGYLLQGYKLKDLPYVAPFYPYSDYLSLSIGGVVTVFMAFGAFFEVEAYDLNWWMNNSWLYGGVGIMVALFCGKGVCDGIQSGKGVMSGFALIPYEEMDFETGRLIETEEDILNEEKSIREIVMSWFTKSSQTKSTK
ncbi:hypothetical protein HDU98_000060 [Podochytrium sp. JEL0797]|nr:hypothetical protein HDU98_000060 [Podochytrium sp. JEL0797]